MLAIHVLFLSLIFITIWLVFAAILDPLFGRLEKFLSKSLTPISPDPQANSKIRILGWTRDLLLFMTSFLLTFYLGHQHFDIQWTQRIFLRTRAQEMAGNALRQLQESEELKKLIATNSNNFGFTAEETIEHLYQQGLLNLDSKDLSEWARLRLLLTKLDTSRSSKSLCLSFLRQQAPNKDYLIKFLEKLSDDDLKSFFSIQVKAITELFKNSSLATKNSSGQSSPEAFPISTIEPFLDFSEAFQLRQLLRNPSHLSTQAQCEVYQTLLRTLPKLSKTEQRQLIGWL